MADYFVDSTTGSDSDNGTTMDLAWATVEHALEAGGLSAGDNVWIRRLHSEIPTSDIASIYDGTSNAYISLIGWPRNTHAISSSDWTNGSTSVTVDDNDMDREKHQNRYITAPDGNVYYITRVSATGTIIIDREYAGSTVTNQAATISADTDYALAQAIDDSGWTINVAAWTADADDVPVIDFNSTAFQIYLSSDDYHAFKNIELKDSTDSNGVLSLVSCQTTVLEGVMIKISGGVYAMSVESAYLVATRLTIEGTATGTAQRGPRFSSLASLNDCAIYNMGDWAMRVGSRLYLNNVNLGVEQANGDDDIFLDTGSYIEGVDVKIGGSNGYVSRGEMTATDKCSIENYQKVLGDNITFYDQGQHERVAVSGETPNKKLSDYVLKISPNASNVRTEETAYRIFEYVFSADTTEYDYSFWIYNDLGVTLNDTTAKDDVWLECQYISAHDDTSEYVITKAYSTEIDILDAADADDWDSISVTGIQPAVAGNLRVRLYVNIYSAAANLFIDPSIVIT